jgi:1-acyl-sn-glycerol-3-phosphate acyltransferase|nr:MAG: 1-acyl-sn-glycerol-3-phosphate acyltransferase [Bacteroidota bacterium]
MAEAMRKRPRWRRWGRLAWLAFWAGVSYPFIAAAASLSFRTWDRSGRAFYRWQRCWGRIVLWSAGVRLRVQGTEAIGEGPFVFVANHTSALDIPVLMVAIPHPFAFIFKKELLRVPVFGFFLRHSPHIMIDRSGRKETLQSLRLAAERIRQGLSAVVFPEGTRSPDGRLLPFKRGAFAIATEAGVPLVPTAIRGAHAVWPARSWSITPGLIEVRFGSPVPLQGSDQMPGEALLEHIRNLLQAELDRPG